MYEKKERFLSKDAFIKPQVLKLIDAREPVKGKFGWEYHLIFEDEKGEGIVSLWQKQINPLVDACGTDNSMWKGKQFTIGTEDYTNAKGVTGKSWTISTEISEGVQQNLG